MELPQGYEIEVLRGRAEGQVADDLVHFWTHHGALEEAAARARVADVVCALRDERGAIAGINSVYRQDVQMLGSRSLWIYRSFVPGAEDPEQWAMIAAARETLNHEFTQSGGEGPIGLVVLVTDVGMIERHPAALWPDLEMIYAGYTPEGAQLRVSYFDDARI